MSKRLQPWVDDLFGMTPSVKRESEENPAANPKADRWLRTDPCPDCWSSWLCSLTRFALAGSRFLAALGMTKRVCWRDLH